MMRVSLRSIRMDQLEGGSATCAEEGAYLERFLFFLLLRFNLLCLFFFHYNKQSTTITGKNIMENTLADQKREKRVTKHQIPIPLLSWLRTERKRTPHALTFTQCRTRPNSKKAKIAKFLAGRQMSNVTRN